MSSGRMNTVHSGSINKNTSAGRIFPSDQLEQFFRCDSVKTAHGFNVKIAVTVPKTHLKFHLPFSP